MAGPARRYFVAGFTLTLKLEDGRELRRFIAVPTDASPRKCLVLNRQHGLDHPRLRVAPGELRRSGAGRPGLGPRQQDASSAHNETYKYKLRPLA